MSKRKKTAIAAVLLCVIGGVAGIPFTWMGMKLAASVGIEAGVGTYVYVILGMGGSVLGIIAGILSLKKPIAAGFMTLAAAAMVGITIIGGYGLNLLVFIIFMIGAILTFGLNKVELEK